MVVARYFALLPGNRCLSSAVGSLSASVVYFDLQCASNCNTNTNCALFQLVRTTNLCVLFSAMTEWYYNANLNSTSTAETCRTFTSGWASCPATPYVFGAKSYYPGSTAVQMQQAMNQCKAIRQQPLKIDSYAEWTYLATYVITSGFYWLGLTGTYSTGDIIWQDGTYLNKTILSAVTWNNDGCCNSPVLCYVAGAGSSQTPTIADDGCTISTFYPLCTCQ